LIRPPNRARAQAKRGPSGGPFGKVWDRGRIGFSGEDFQAASIWRWTGIRLCSVVSLLVSGLAFPALVWQSVRGKVTRGWWMGFRSAFGQQTGGPSGGTACIQLASYQANRFPGIAFHLARFIEGCSWGLGLPKAIGCCRPGTGLARAYVDRFSPSVPWRLRPLNEYADSNDPFAQFICGKTARFLRFEGSPRGHPGSLGCLRVRGWHPCAITRNGQPQGGGVNERWTAIITFVINTPPRICRSLSVRQQDSAGVTSTTSNWSKEFPC